MKSFSDYLKIKDGEPVSPFSEPVPPVISADVEGDEAGPGDLGSPGQGKKMAPLEFSTKRAEPEFGKDGVLKKKINESVCEDFHMKSVDGNKFNPPMHEVARYVAEMVSRYPDSANKLLREAKRRGSFDHIVGEAMEHPEFFNVVTKKLSHKEHGPKHARKLVKAMHSRHEKASKYGLEESVDGPKGVDSGLGMSASPALPSANDMPMASSIPSPAPAATDAGGFNYGSNSNTSSMSPPAALDLPPTSKTEGKMAHHHLIDEMTKCDPMHGYMKECMGMM